MLLFGLDRVPRVPGGLVVLAAAIVLSWALRLDAHGVDTVGKVPAGLPSLHGLDLSVHDLWVLLPSAGGMMLVIFSEFPTLESAVSWARGSIRTDDAPEAQMGG